MPIYEYVCRDCGARFSALRAIRDMDAPAQCPKCGGATGQRQISVVAAAAKCGPVG
jgi:putative FmdB family regulatory protein